MKELYKAIACKLRETGHFQMIDLYSGQFEDGAESRLLPAALIEFQTGNGRKLSGGKKVYDCLVVIRVMGDLYEDTDALSETHDDAVERFFNIMEVADSKLDGIRMDGKFEQLVCRDMKPDPEYTHMFAHMMTYECQVYFGKDRSEMLTTLQNVTNSINKN